MPVFELNFEQIAHLEEIGVMPYIGEGGANYLRSVIKESSYDPASSVQDLRTANTEISTALQKYAAVEEALSGVGYPYHSLQEIPLDGSALARVQFISDAAINHIADLKKWANDWNDIVRGVGLCVGETSSDVKVVGASRGSVIIWITGSFMFITLLAFMSRKVTEIVLNGLRVAEAIEDLRHKKITNAAIEQALRSQQAERESNIIDELVEELKNKSQNFEPEHEANIQTAIKKFVNFSKKGGLVDYIEPPESNDNDLENNNVPAVDSEAALIVQELRELITDIRSMKAETRLLEHKPEQEEYEEDVKMPD